MSDATLSALRKMVTRKRSPKRPNDGITPTAPFCAKKRKQAAQVRLSPAYSSFVCVFSFFGSRGANLGDNLAGHAGSRWHRFIAHAHFSIDPCCALLRAQSLSSNLARPVARLH